MLTEAEAKTKWCPLSTPINAYSYSKCRATDCMAWRQTDNKTWPSAPGEPERAPEPAGYCGLAGAL